MQYYGIIKTKQNGNTIEERSIVYNNQLHAECWLGSVCREARELKIKIVDHYIIRQA